MLPRPTVLRAIARRLAALPLLGSLVLGPSAPSLASQITPDGAAVSPDRLNDTPGLLAGADASAPDRAELAAASRNLPLSFEANQGQADSSVEFLVHGRGYTLSLSHGDAVLDLRQPVDPAPAGTKPEMDAPSSVVGMLLRGAALEPKASASEQLPGTANYVLGNDPGQWHTGIATYARVQYADVYPGIDLVYYGNQGSLEDDFVVKPGAVPSVIRLGFPGAEQLRLDDAGELVMQLRGGELRQAAPVMYQDGPDGRRPVPGGYVLNDAGDVGFAVGVYDASQPLIIDPVLVYSTFLGGTVNSGGLNSGGQGIALDGAGNAYITGIAYAAGFPITPGGFRPTFGGGTDDVFVAKLNPTGTALLYSTYLGGTEVDGGLGIAVDSAGNAYVTGFTRSADFPTSPAVLQPSIKSPNGGLTAFVTKLNPTGTALVYSTFLGGVDGETQGSSIALDAARNAYVTGLNSSTDFPTTPGAFQRVLGGQQNAFVTKLNPSATAAVYSTLLGGNGVNGGDGAWRIAVDTAGDAYVTGTTTSANFPTTPGVFRRSFGDGFVTKLNPTGSALVYSTYLACSTSGIAVDKTGNAYVTGSGFASKLNSTGTALVYSTALGDSGCRTLGNFLPPLGGIAVDAAGNAYVIGDTNSINFPTTPGAFQPTRGGNDDVFVAKLNPTGSAFLYSTYLGGHGNDLGYDIAVDAAGNAYVTGYTQSANFPTTPGALERTFSGGTEAFVAKIGPELAPACQLSGTGTNAHGQRFIQITAQDASSGLQSIAVTVATNVSLTIPNFTPGTLNPVVVTATKMAPSIASVVSLRVSSARGGFVDCDPAMLSIGSAPGDSPVQVIHHVAQGESHVTIVNGSPGVERVKLVVNGHRFVVADLEDGETRTLDVSAAMRKGTDNTILAVSHGPRDSSAVIIVSDS